MMGVSEASTTQSERAGPRVLDRRPGILADADDRGLDAGVHRHGDGEVRLVAAGRPDHGGVVIGGVV